MTSSASAASRGIQVSHMSVAPFVQQAAAAFAEANALAGFVTTLRWNPHSPWQRSFCRLSRAVGFDLERQLRRRTVDAIDADLVIGLPGRETLRLLTDKMLRSPALTDRVWAWAEPSFDRAVSRRLTPEHTGAYAFEYGALTTLQRARELGVPAIYDVPAPQTEFVQDLLAAECERFPSLLAKFGDARSPRESKRTERRKAEWHAADLVIAASQFTKSSFAQAGLDDSKVRVVPYGAPPPVAEEVAARGGRPKGKLNLIWAGTFSHRKGAHYLLQAWEKHHLHQLADLRIFGAQVLPEEMITPLPAGIEFGGSIPRDELMRQYQASDALVFPTLCDGFGMVVTEAWSCGLPVITTNRAGAADLLRPRENGLLCEPGDGDSLAQTIQWCAENRRELSEMRISSRQSAADWQWSDYRAELRSAISPFVPELSES